MKKSIILISRRRGSAIIMAMVTMVVLLLLGLAVATVSLGMLKINTADATTNNAYYAARSAITSAIEQLKYEVSSYYTQMQTVPYSEYGTLYANFFSGINTNAQSHFAEPVFDNVTTQTTFEMGSFDETDSVCEFLISSTATTADHLKYLVSGKLYVKKVDLSKSGGTWLEVDDAAYKVGGTLSLSKSGFEVHGGNVVTSVFSNPRGKSYTIDPPGQMILDPNTASSINNCLTYPSYTTPTLGAPDLYVTVNNTTLGWGSFPTDRPVVITSAPGVSFTISGGTTIYPGSVVYCRGSKLTLMTNMPSGSPPIYCYSDGDLTASNGYLNANMYCRGNATTSGNIEGNITCDGSALIGGTFIGGTVKAGDSITVSGGYDANYYADGDISISNGLKGNNHVVYAGGNLTISGGANANAVFFSGGDITIESGPTVTGAVIAKGNATQSSWFTVNYSHSVIEAIINDPDNASFFGGGTGGVEPLDEDVFISQKITAQGRQP